MRIKNVFKRYSKRVSIAFGACLSLLGLALNGIDTYAYQYDIATESMVTENKFICGSDTNVRYNNNTRYLIPNYGMVNSGEVTFGFAIPSVFFVFSPYRDIMSNLQINYYVDSTRYYGSISGDLYDSVWVKPYDYSSSGIAEYSATFTIPRNGYVGLNCKKADNTAFTDTEFNLLNEIFDIKSDYWTSQDNYLESWIIGFSNNSEGWQNLPLNFTNSDLSSINAYIEKDAYERGFASGQAKQSDVSYEEGYNVGYNVGKEYGIEIGEASNFSLVPLIASIGSIPFSAFKEIWSFDILGFNIGNFVIGIFSIGLVLWIIRKFMGGD